MRHPQKEEKEELFDEELLSSLTNLADLYAQAKSLILYSEEIDPSARSNIQVIKELRDANDHLMRVLAAKLSSTPPDGFKEEGYCKKNIEKAIGHVYRAAFDSLDGTVMSLREKISEILNSYSLETIKEVIPNYWELRKNLDKLTNDVASHRAAKDVGGNIADTLACYVQDTESIKGFYKQIIESGDALDAYENKHNKEKKKSFFHHFSIHTLSGLAYSAIIGVFLLFIGYMFGANNDQVETHTSKATPSNSQPKNNK